MKPVYIHKDRNAPGSIWKIISPNGAIFYLSTVDEDFLFKKKLKGSTRGDLNLQKSCAVYGIEAHVFEKIASDVPRKELTIRKRELILANTRTTKNQRKAMAFNTPEEFKSRIEEYDPSTKVALYDTSVQFMWIQKGGKWIKEFKSKKERVRDGSEPWDKMAILDRMEMCDHYLQMGDGEELEELEDPEGVSSFEFPPIPEDIDD